MYTFCMNTSLNDKTRKQYVQRSERYKSLLDADIEAYSKKLKKDTLKEYGPNSHTAIKAFVDVLSRGGKRIRGALAMLAYEMSGGTDTGMIVKAARALELAHTYILIMDDIHDRSRTRRGGLAAHIMLMEYHEKHHLFGDSLHFGESIANNAALVGSHLSQTVLADLDVDDSLKIRALGVLNRTLAVTGHGQSNDIFNEVIESVDEQQIEDVFRWKTAHYTFINPLYIGMILAGADKTQVNAITDYAMQAGRLFQITDDILGTFGSEFESGKSPLDDIKEGKRTLLIIKALEFASKADGYFLRECLGVQSLTKADFERCKQIIEESGSLAYSQKQADKAEAQAIRGLSKIEPYWPEEGIQFLAQLVHNLTRRKN